MRKTDLLAGAAGIAMLVLLPLLFSCRDKASWQADVRPNILFIMSDDHTGQAWGVYGGALADYVRAPGISRLAEEGCVLDNCLVSNSICTPSRATILTGQYSHLNGVRTLADALRPGAGNIAGLLQEDPHELHNAYLDPVYQRIIAAMKEELKMKREELGDTDEEYPEMGRIIDEYWD